MNLGFDDLEDRFSAYVDQIVKESGIGIDKLREFIRRDLNADKFLDYEFNGAHSVHYAGLKKGFLDRPDFSAPLAKERLYLILDELEQTLSKRRRARDRARDKTSLLCVTERNSVILQESDGQGKLKSCVAYSGLHIDSPCRITVISEVGRLGGELFHCERTLSLRCLRPSGRGLGLA